MWLCSDSMSRPGETEGGSLAELLKSEDALAARLLPLLEELRREAVAEAAASLLPRRTPERPARPASSVYEDEPEAEGSSGSPIYVDEVVRRLAASRRSGSPEELVRLAGAVGDVCDVLRLGGYFAWCARARVSGTCALSTAALAGDLTPEAALQAGRKVASAKGAAPTVLSSAGLGSRSSEA